MLVYGVGEEKASKEMKCLEKIRLMEYLSCTGGDRQSGLPNWRRKAAAGPDGGCAGIRCGRGKGIEVEEMFGDGQAYGVSFFMCRWRSTKRLVKLEAQGRRRVRWHG